MDEVYVEVRALFGALPRKEARKIKRKKNTLPLANAEESEGDEFEEFSGQRIVFVLG